MKKSYIAVALIILVSGFLAVLTVEAQRSKSSNQTKDVKVVKEGSGFDGIVVGRSTRADVIKKFGKNYKTKNFGKYSTQLIYPGGMSFYYCQSDKRQQIFDIELRAPFKAKTGKGITLSQSTLQDIYRIYGKKPLQSNGLPDLEYRGVSFFYDKYRGKNVVTVIDIVENSGIRQCKESK
jgi:hypothetical protein